MVEQRDRMERFHSKLEGWNDSISMFGLRDVIALFFVWLEGCGSAGSCSANSHCVRPTCHRLVFFFPSFSYEHRCPQPWPCMASSCATPSAAGAGPLLQLGLCSRSSNNNVVAGRVCHLIRHAISDSSHRCRHIHWSPLKSIARSPNRSVIT